MTTREEFELLGHLATVNTGLGRAVQRILQHQQDHGQLPADELRELGSILAELGTRLTTAADRIDRPVSDTPTL
ncbi:hypothetical protein ORV05_26290 [Amycolatopsis cynarae]|uniref:Uncharacterized protein n=1 Tax=Amycolatopsis cynarae TaxID=2995223 RepID=A0ABY7B0L6_9PSEU|nr:hypothetical protein [Amycolatopsis sp. HUAS 11-8]WAL64456.1 hypothetical protein ORV05_26290 [Amycolatopsis sp. HUAS 11-8]